MYNGNTNLMAKNTHQFNAISWSYVYEILKEDCVKGIGYPGNYFNR